jgi:3-hydroxybutyryl-CoA dehydrogenase
MGSGIAQVFAQADHRVILVDVTQEAVDRGLDCIRKNLDKQVAKGTLTALRVDGVLSSINGSIQYGDLASCRLVIEAVPENRDVKRQVLGRIEAVVTEECIIATNTSTISISELAAAIASPRRFIGMHFVNPVPAMRLVEVIAALQTAEEIVSEIIDLAARLGKTPVRVSDSPGFVLNRLLIPMINEAVFALDEGLADSASIDACMKLGANHPLGPLALADLIGLDICLDIMDVLHADFGDSKYRACPLLRRMVAAGYLGRKTGKGFFGY